MHTKLQLDPKRIKSVDGACSASVPVKKTGSIACTRQTLKSDVEHSTWVQCDACSKWRRAPNGEILTRLGSKFTCDQNTWDFRNKCAVAEEKLGDEGTDYVEAVVGRRMSRSGHMEYCLKWLGTTEKTWEPVTNCVGCQHLIAEYEKA